MTVLFEAWPPVPPISTETSAKPSFSSTTASRTNSLGVATTVSLSTMLIRLLALVIAPLTGRAQVEGEGLEALDVRTVEDLDAYNFRRLAGREVERALTRRSSRRCSWKRRRCCRGRVVDRDRVRAWRGQADRQVDEAVALAHDRVGWGECSGCELAPASLAPIVIHPLPSEIVALVGLLRLSEDPSTLSGVPSSAIGTTTVLAVSPGAKVSVPLTEV